MKAVKRGIAIFRSGITLVRSGIAVFRSGITFYTEDHNTNWCLLHSAAILPIDRLVEPAFSVPRDCLFKTPSFNGEYEDVYNSNSSVRTYSSLSLCQMLSLNAYPVVESNLQLLYKLYVCTYRACVWRGCKAGVDGRDGAIR